MDLIESKPFSEITCRYCSSPHPERLATEPWRVAYLFLNLSKTTSSVAISGRLGRSLGSLGVCPAASLRAFSISLCTSTSRCGPPRKTAVSYIQHLSLHLIDARWSSVRSSRCSIFLFSASSRFARSVSSMLRSRFLLSARGRELCSSLHAEVNLGNRAEHA